MAKKDERSGGRRRVKSEEPGKPLSLGSGSSKPYLSIQFKTGENSWVQSFDYQHVLRQTLSRSRTA
jgi:hypothetical protein